MSRDPRIDAYIAKAAPFARPILEHVQSRVHAVAPDAVETTKWSAPAFTVDGKILLIMAAFKAHAAINFWRGQVGQRHELTELAHAVGIGFASAQFLPADTELDRLIARAAELAKSAPAPRQVKHAPKAPAAIHPDFDIALKANPKARETLDGFPPSARREYLDWVAEAKQESTRAKRIADSVQWLSEGKRRHWKYENC